MVGFVGIGIVFAMVFGGYLLAGGMFLFGIALFAMLWRRARNIDLAFGQNDS